MFFLFLAKIANLNHINSWTQMTNLNQSYSTGRSCKVLRFDIVLKAVLQVSHLNGFEWINE